MINLNIKTISILIIGALVGILFLVGNYTLLNKTSETEFCVSCHSMTIPYEEYQSSIHYSNAKGIRAECSDCHIPNDPIDYMITKIRASKDIYHEFITGKLDSEEQYEIHRGEMAEVVWDKLRAIDSATCRSCHNVDAMDSFEQSEDAAKMHLYAVENDQTCIDCHKGVAHYPPEVVIDSAALDNLIESTKTTPISTPVVYPIQNMQFGELGTIPPGTKLDVIGTSGGVRTVKVTGYQKQGAESVIYLDKGKRMVIASVTELGVNSLDTAEYTTDEYGSKWRQVSIAGPLIGDVLGNLDPLWDYARELNKNYCSSCHPIIPTEHFTVNAWPSIAKSMGTRTDIKEDELEILIKFFQYNAKDINKL